MAVKFATTCVSANTVPSNCSDLNKNKPPKNIKKRTIVTGSVARAPRIRMLSQRAVSKMHCVVKNITATEKFVRSMRPSKLLKILITNGANSAKQINRKQSIIMEVPTCCPSFAPVEEAKGMDTYVDVVEGMQFDRGYLSPYFVTDADKMIADLENPYVLLFDKKISNLQEILKSVIIGLLLAQLLTNSLSFDNRISIFMIVTIIALQLGAGIFDGDVLSVVISVAILIGFMPFFETKINKKIGTGQGRSVALGVSTLMGIILIFSLTGSAMARSGDWLRLRSIGDMQLSL